MRKQDVEIHEQSTYAKAVQHYSGYSYRTEASSERMALAHSESDAMRSAKKSPSEAWSFSSISLSAPELGSRGCGRTDGGWIILKPSCMASTRVSSYMRMDPVPDVP